MTAWPIAIPALAFSVFAAPLSAQDAAPLALAASGNWTADFADDHCAVRRSFANGGRCVTLEFRSYVPSEKVEARLVSKTLQTRVRRPSTGFRPNGEQQPVENYRTLSAEGWEGISYNEELPPSGEEAASYRARGVFVTDVELMLGPLSGVRQILRTCEDDLLGTLGLDASANRSLSRRIELTGDEMWLPVTAPMQRDFIRKGSVFQQVRLLVDEQGAVFGCSVVEGSVDDAISKRLCDAVLKDANFQPALDANSQPVKSYFILALSAARRVERQR